ncbi:tetratricopeptide repeat protein [uncultured Draconibacterium sp.]|uniref:tetratricopeptide repeat protein n=1 Tax=uncultured Draconibacterium sp. TaxID=1573823 RepID=UPI003216D6E2
MAQQQQNQKNQSNAQQQNSGSSQQSSQAANNTSTQNQQQQNNQSLAQNNSNDKEEEEAEEEARNRRRKMNLIVEDSRDLPSEQEEEEVDDGRIQNKNIVIDLQPLFLIAAFEKNGVDYDRFQYYNIVIDDLNAKNNYDPLLSISNKPVTTYQSVFENFILFFNEKIGIQENAHNYLNRGIFYSLTGDYNRALQDLNKSIELDDKASIAYFTRANSLYKMQEQIELLAGAQKNVSITMRDKNSTADPETEKVTSLDYAKILEDYELTLFLNPEFFFGYYNRAYIKLRLGEYKSAVEDLNRAIELEPEICRSLFQPRINKDFP